MLMQKVCGAILFAGLLSIAATGVAGSFYKYTDPETGKTVYSDMPPPAEVEESGIVDADDPYDAAADRSTRMRVQALKSFANSSSRPRSSPVSRQRTNFIRRRGSSCGRL